MIKQLCRSDPFERIGYQKGGICDIRKHRWFQGFNWEALRNQALVLGSTNHFHLKNGVEVKPGPLLMLPSLATPTR